MKFKVYQGETLYNVEVSYKIDGVRAHLVDDRVVSRAGKPLYNVPKIHDVCEVFLGDWERTISAVHTFDGALIEEQFLYSLNPIDPRLFVGTYDVITAADVSILMEKALSLNYEGLVIKTDKYYYKVKQTHTYDVKVLGVIPGKGKHVGKVGALLTELGKVGTGFSDKDRESDYKDLIIEVKCMSLTPNGKFRHPRFVRIRYDK